MSTVLTVTVGATQSTSISNYGQWTGGTTYNLSSGAVANSWYVGDEGLGLAPMHRINERGVLQDGNTDLGFRLDPRNFTIFIGIQGTSLSDLENQQYTLLNIFNPYNSYSGASGNANPMQMTWQLDNGKSYTLDCYYTGNLTNNSKDRSGFTRICAINLYAPDPTFYNPSTYNSPSVGTTNSSGTTYTGSGTITNGGTAPARPYVYISSAFENWSVGSEQSVILNSTNGFYFKPTTADLGTRNLYVASTYGKLSLTDDNGRNWISWIDLTQTNSVGIPAFVLYPGSNPVTINFVCGTNTSGNPNLIFFWYSRYAGF